MDGWIVIALRERKRDCRFAVFYLHFIRVTFWTMKETQNNVYVRELTSVDCLYRCIAQIMMETLFSVLFLHMHTCSLLLCHEKKFWHGNISRFFFLLFITHACGQEFFWGFFFFLRKAKLLIWICWYAVGPI